MFDASLYLPPHKTPHGTLLKRSVDGKPVPLVCSGLDAQSKEKALSSRDQLNEGRIVGESFTEAQYKQWLSNRQSMRSNLESLGANEQWLLFKERTLLENTLLSQLREKEKAAKSRVEDREKVEVRSILSGIHACILDVCICLQTQFTNECIQYVYVCMYLNTCVRTCILLRSSMNTYLINCYIC